MEEEEKAASIQLPLPPQLPGDADERSRGAAGSGRDVCYRCYGDERDLELVTRLVDAELSEPYSIFTYRYFMNQWPELCLLAEVEGGGGGEGVSKRCVGTIVCKAEWHKSGTMRGYIAMLVVDKPERSRGIGKSLVKRAIAAMRDYGCDEVVLETEMTNIGALRLYERLGFIRDKRLQRYYLNSQDAFRLKLRFPAKQDEEEEELGSGLGDLAGLCVVGNPVAIKEDGGSDEETKAAAEHLQALSMG